MADAAAQAQFRQLGGYLKDIGLGALFQVDSSGNPSGWLWNKMQSGEVDTTEELMIAIEQTDVYRNRFGVIVEQKARAAKGEPVYVMSVDQVLDYERRATEAMVASGIPAWFYDKPDDFAKLMLKNISVEQIANKLSAAYDYVKAAPPEVRAAFQDYYGANGDGALAAWALDPERTLVDINRATRTAYTSGMATRFDVGISRSTAERIADLPQTEAGITQGLTNVAAMKGVFQEGIGEATDITTDQGVQSVFEGDADATKAIGRRIGQRKAVDRSSTGGAVITNEGVVGAGASGR